MTKTARGSSASECWASSPDVLSLSLSMFTLFMFTLLPQHVATSYPQDWATWSGEATGWNVHQDVRRHENGNENHVPQPQEEKQISCQFWTGTYYTIDRNILPCEVRLCNLKDVREKTEKNCSLSCIAIRESLSPKRWICLAQVHRCWHLQP